MIDIMKSSKEFEKALLMMDRVMAEKIIRDSILHSTIVEIAENVVIVALERIGRGWQDGNVALAQVYMSGIICEEIMDLVLASHPIDKKNKVKIGIAVLEDHHQLGKRIICSILRASGYEIVDYGHGVSVEELIVKTINDDLAILLISTLMLPSALKVRDVVKGLKEQGGKTRVVAGGACFRLDPTLAKSMGVETVNNASDLPAFIERVVNEA